MLITIWQTISSSAQREANIDSSGLWCVQLKLFMIG